MAKSTWLSVVPAGTTTLARSMAPIRTLVYTSNQKTIERMHVIKSVNKRTIQSFLVKWLDFIESMVYTAFTRRERVYDFFFVRLAFFLSAERKRFLHC